MDLALFARLSAFVLYLSFMVFIGIRYIGKNDSSSAFFLGSRNVGPWLTALSAEASDMSGWLLMGLPGLAYLGGMKEAFWTALGLTLGTYFNWLIVAKPLRRCTVHFGDSITIPEFLTNRFNDKSHVLQAVSVVFIVAFFTIYTASGFVACAKLFNSVFGLDYHVGLVIGLLVILSYTILGGYLAVCATDFIQGSLMFVALILITIIAVASFGSVDNAVQGVKVFALRAINGEYSEAMQKAFVRNQNYSIVNVISALAWGLGYFGMPHILVRFMGIRCEDDIKLSRKIATVWVVVAFIGAVVAGALGTAYLQGRVGILESSETVVSKMIQVMFPAFIAGVFLCAILAAAMSTADSQLLVASSAFARDIYKGLVKKDATEKSVLSVSRITVFAIAAVAFLLSLDQNSSIFALVSYAWAGFGATFGPLVLLALFWRGTTRNGAISGLVAGGIVVVFWHNMKGGIFDIYEILPAFLVCMIVAIIVSLLDKNKDENMLAQFDSYKNAI